jgi:hypothetical protein
MHTPLAGLKILDASRVLAGPFCGQLLADLGAEVIKLERPGAGDDTRSWGPPFLDTQMSAYYLSANRGKRAFALDLGKPDGLALFHELIDKCDTPLTADTEAFLDLYARARHAYTAMRFDEALVLFDQAQQMRPHDKAVAVHLSRARQYKIQPPPKNWDGVFVMTTK